LCPGGNAGGVSPPPPPTCTATVPAGNSADQFTVGVPAGISLAIAACDASGTSCTTPLLPDGGSGNVFTVTRTARYQLTASSSSAQQVCQFTIPTSGCITRAGSFSQPPCNAWMVDTTGAWVGRGIAVPDFAGP